MLRNVSGQKIRCFAFDYTTGAPKTGDAANLTAYLDKDYGGITVLTDTSAAEISSSNAPGWYTFDVSQSESNGSDLHFTGKSSTANVAVVFGPPVKTRPQYFDVSAIDSSGRYDISKLGGDSQSLTDLKDFADTGYDPSTHKVQGVVLVDTLTTYTGNTPQTGDTFARITGTGAVTFESLTVSGTTTFTGAIAATNASNALRLGTFTVDTNAVTWNSSWDAEVQSECTDALDAISATALARFATINTGTLLAAPGSVCILSWNPATSLRAAVGLASANLDAQLDALPTNSELTTALTTISSYIDTEVAAILASVDTEVTAIVTAVTSTLPTQISGLLTGAMTESYAADGATMSVAQALYMLRSIALDAAASGTTLTTYKLDGVTQAMVLTMNDATTPTAIVRTA